MKMISRRALGALAVVFALVGAIFPVAVAPAAQPPALTVFAAASMKTALDAIAAAWVAHGGAAPAIVYGSSAVLAKQIEQAAPADIFISADLKWMDYLDKAKLLRPGTRHNLLGNELVLIEPADHNTALKIAAGFDLAGEAGEDRIAVCAVSSCPAGVYGKEALTALGVWDRVERKLAQADNVRAALTLVARGEARFGIVYATDAKSEPKVRVIDVFPASSHSPIVYPVAVVETSKNPEAANFVAFLSSQAAVGILKEQGFSILSK